jgi:vacuolar-type H+-ATPase subunit H
MLKGYHTMLSDVMNKIKNVEENILIKKAEAQTKAKNMIAEVEKKGQAEVAAAVLRAEEDAKKLLDEADQRAAAITAELKKSVEETQEEIKRLSASRLDDVAHMIAERIVNG